MNLTTVTLLYLTIGALLALAVFGLLHLIDRTACTLDQTRRVAALRADIRRFGGPATLVVAVTVAWPFAAAAVILHFRNRR